MTKTPQDIKEVTMVSWDDSLIYESGTSTYRVKMSTLYSKLICLQGLSVQTISNPYNNSASETTISDGNAVSGIFTIPYYAYDKTSYKDMIVYSSTRELTFSTDYELVAIVIKGQGNSEKSVRVSFDGISMVFPNWSTDPISLAHVFTTPVNGSLTFTFSNPCRMKMTLYYRKKS